MAILKDGGGIFLNQYSGLNGNYGARIYSSTRTWAPFQSGVNMIQMTQAGATSTRQVISIVMKWAAIRTSGSKTELPALNALARCSLNTNGTISQDGGWDWQSWGGNGILWPYILMGGASTFIGADSGQGTGMIGSVMITVCTLEWDKLSINIFGD